MMVKIKCSEAKEGAAARMTAMDDPEAARNAACTDVCCPRDFVAASKRSQVLFVNFYFTIDRYLSLETFLIEQGEAEKEGKLSYTEKSS